MQCQHETAFDDMYPEFAPDPIVVICTQRATHHFMVAEDRSDDGGYPLEGQREVVHVWLCQGHAVEALSNGGVADPMYHGRLIRTEVTQ